jgi:tripartite-type tricarboxylate transporter receptor subunit TctC
MIRTKLLLILGPVVFAANAMFGATAFSQDNLSFAGKNVTMTVGNAAGGSADLYGRVVGRYLMEHLPGGPNLVVINPGVPANTLRDERGDPPLVRG